ncbi:MAG: hypothetical protein EOO93_13120 [Pedobacter sp.]|nr:MAG: hypothetical protein EOO93_13120 [Pedobacter sp.]
MKYLIIEPLGGLANRMRAIESAVNYANSHERKLMIVWEKNAFLNADFFDCFRPVNGAKVIQLDYLGVGIISKVKRRILNVVKWMIKLVYRARYIPDAEIEVLLKDHEYDLGNVGGLMDAIADNSNGIYIKSCYEFYPNLTGFLVEIDYKAQQLGNQILNSHRCDIGIHIRRTDHTEAINNSPIDLFKTKISEKLTSHPHYKFYLSTDSSEVVDYLERHFSSHIITGISNRDRHSEEGIRSALIDLHCLGKCVEIWGSDQSSFSDRAARINGSKLEILSLKNISA